MIENFKKIKKSNKHISKISLFGNTIKTKRSNSFLKRKIDNLPNEIQTKLPNAIPNIKKFTFNKFTNQTRKSKIKPKTIKQYCEIYKNDITGKVNMPLYNSCKINQYCRKYKCKNIDKKFKQAQINKLGINYNTLLMSSLYSKCPADMIDKNRKRCNNRAMMKFYEANSLGSLYKNVIECDKKTCAKEKQIFHNNLFRIRNKHQKKIKINKPLIIEDLPDKEMIEIN
jgi:hypothetical protein